MAKIKAGGTMIAAIATLTIGFFLAVAIILPFRPDIFGGKSRHKSSGKRGSRLRALKKLTVHLKGRVKRKKPFMISAPPREWKKQPLNKLRFYNNYINKKAEIAPIR